ncbi:hypothetical protein A2397_04620 [Candidatus Amesbacteria bacterium RIFOXYB1_FULL_44_23]|uniref:Uncharacterized protein n=1 Tax=Candidatus Amesbacteria bacterium RIFOXYB1_FULL_44_23 TaxID=1797263 RepID=A0A1F4ZUN0_9BACT|nr:MAG: hypothetical protein A2397_04620 [Candidatus Amesbacteria bacterium RIFOXYB1_FULL_44_23]
MSKNIIILVLAVIVTGAVGFFAGTKYQQSQAFSNRQFMMRPGGTFQTGGVVQSGQMGSGIRNGFRPVSGEIVSADEKSITVKLADGGSKIILLTDNTNINKAETATSADLKLGISVVVFGSVNPDGSVTAQNIQLNPVMIGQQVK